MYHKMKSGKEWVLACTERNKGKLLMADYETLKEHTAVATLATVSMSDGSFK